MQVRDVVVGADGRDVEHDSARRVRTVHQDRHAPGVAVFRDSGTGNTSALSAAM